jgi:hypothetical protein
MRQADRHATGPQALSPLLTGTLALLALAAVAGEVGAQAGAAIDHWRRRPPVDPLALVLEIADGRTRWPPAGTPILIAVTSVCAVIVIGFLLDRALRRYPASGADRAARLLGTGRSVHPISLPNARATAERFGVEQPGLPIAKAVAGGETLYATWEDMQCDIWGPRRARARAVRSRRCWPRRAPRSRPRTSPTCTRRHGRSANRTAGCEISIRSRSRRASRTGGGTRSATSPPIAARSS